MGLRAYFATSLHVYRATRLHAQSNKGVPEMAPRSIAVRYYSSHPKGLKSFFLLFSFTQISMRPTTGLRSYRATRLPSYQAIGLRHCLAGRWLLIDILTAYGRARIIHRAIDSVAGLPANLVERFRMGVSRRGFLIPCIGDDLTDGLDAAD